MYQETPSGYQKGESISAVAKRYGLKEYEILKLDANENLFIPLRFLQEIIQKVSRNIDPRYYPTVEMENLRDQIASVEGVPRESLVLGTGVDQIIDLVIRAYAKRGGVISISPTFSMYKIACVQNQVGYDEVSLTNDFQLDLESILGRIDERTRVLFLCSPNNPTGNQFSRDDILALCSSFHGLLVLDETYVDFADYSAKEYISSISNLLIMRSFSKSWGLAGLRLGYLLTDCSRAKALQSSYQMPFPNSIFALRMAEYMLKLEKYVTRISNQVKLDRTYLFDRLKEIDGVQVFPSDANFIAISVSKPSDLVQQELRKSGILVKNLGSVLGYPNCLRVTVPPREIADRFIEKLEVIL